MAFWNQIFLYLFYKLVELQQEIISSFIALLPIETNNIALGSTQSKNETIMPWLFATQTQVLQLVFGSVKGSSPFRLSNKRYLRNGKKEAWSSYWLKELLISKYQKDHSFNIGCSKQNRSVITRKLYQNQAKFYKSHKNICLQKKCCRLLKTCQELRKTLPKALHYCRNECNKRIRRRETEPS